MSRTAAALVLLAAGALAALLAPSARADGDANAPDNPDGDWSLPDLDMGAIFSEGDQVGQMPVSMSAAGLAMLQGLEGFSSTPYADHKGYSIGYGHLIQPGEDLTYVTQEQAVQLLAQDVAGAQAAVAAAVRVGLSQNQFDALVSFVYNVGAGAFRSSTLLKLLNAGDYAGAAAQFPRWINASGAPSPALVARRGQEQNLFEG